MCGLCFREELTKEDWNLSTKKPPSLNNEAAFFMS
jgi:hypothetical protein